MRESWALIGETLASVWLELCDMRLEGQGAREATKTVLGVLLALLLSLALLEVEDVYWAAFSAFMITRPSASETTSRGWLRILGTVGGAVAGLLLAKVTADSAFLMILSMAVVGFVSIFQFQQSRYSYGWMFAGLTALLVLTATLSDPRSTIPFAAIRVAEIVLGVLGAMLVSVVFDYFRPVSPPAPPVIRPSLPLWRGVLDEAWLAAHWTKLFHALRSALALALLPLVWRAIELQDFTGTATTSLLVTLVPGASLADGGVEAMRRRGAHRLVGCTLGGTAALLCLHVVSDDLGLWLLALAGGVWVAASIQNGRRGVAYCGSQVGLGFLVTFVQGGGPPTSILPGLERFEGVLIGLIVLALVAMLVPFPARAQSRSASGSCASVSPRTETT